MISLKVALVSLLALLPFASSTYDTIPQGNLDKIRTVVRRGKSQCCCTGAGDCQTWGNPCKGDLDYPLCNPDEVLHVDPQGESYFGQSKVFDTGNECVNGCNWKKYDYKYFCAQCPYGYVRFDKDECAWGNLCVGCKNVPYEKLNGTSPPFDCVANPNPCPRISSFTDPYIKDGSQIVVDPDFKPKVQSLITCAKNAFGAKGGVYVVSTARCGDSVGLTPAPPGKSDHEIGKAIDIQPYTNDSAICGRDDCMKSGYCYFNPSKADCQGFTNTNTPSKNDQLKKFFTCATQISGLKTGAAFSEGDWDHWETGESVTVDKKNAFYQQLSAFCRANPGCPGITKKNPSDAACKCFK